MQLCYLKLLLIVLAAVTIGCRESEQIRQYRIPKSRSDLGELGVKQLPVSPTATANNTRVESRMVVAISERSDATWFFKATGSVPAVNASEDQWQSIFKSVTFDDNGQPDWKLPEGWRLGPPRSMRFATLLGSFDGGQVEISISSLGPNQDLLDNVNRWRGQLGLPPLTDSDPELATIESASGELKIFDAVGEMVLTGAMAPTTSNPPLRPELKYEIPEGWIESQQSMMVPVRLRYGSDTSRSQITVTQLLAAANRWLPNAQRWAGQVGVPEDEANVASLTEEIMIDSIPGQKIVLIPTDEESEFAMVGAMIVRNDIAWFFKFIGQKEFVADNQVMFDQFLESFKFDQE